MTAVYNVGDIINGVYRVVKILEGGMSLVYVCEATPEYASEEVRRAAANWPANSRLTALKSFHREHRWSPGQLQRMQQEALTWISLLPHPNIVRAQSFDMNTGYPLIFLEFIPGGNLRELIFERSLPTERVLELSLQVAVGMSFIWETAGLVHRDLKPENILLSQDHRALITDFGISKPWIGGQRDTARLFDHRPLPEDWRKTRTDVLGTLPYMAPEVLTGTNNATPVSDMYSFGVVLYEMLTGTLPFAGPSPADFVAQHTSGTLRLPSELSDTPASFDKIVARALHKDPRERYQSFRDLYAAIVTFSGDNNLRVPEPQDPSTEQLEELLDAPAWNNRSYAFQQLGKIHEAHRCVDRGLELDPDAAALWANLAYCYRAEGKPIEDVIPLQEKSIALSPDWGYLRSNLAFSYEHLGEIGKAVDQLEEYVELEPSAIRGHRRLAILYWKTSRTEQFESSFARMDELLPSKKYPAAVDILQEAIKLEEADIISAAEKLYLKARDVFPEHPLVHYNLGVFFQKQHAFPRALESYQRAVDLDPELQHAYINRAVVLLRLGQKGDALTELQKQSLVPFRDMALLRRIPGLIEHTLGSLCSNPPHIL